MTVTRLSPLAAATFAILTLATVGCDLRPKLLFETTRPMSAAPASIHPARVPSADLRGAGLAQIVVRTVGRSGMADSLRIELSDGEQRQVMQPGDARRNTTFTVAPGSYSLSVKGGRVQFPLVRVSVSVGYADTVELALGSP